MKKILTFIFCVFAFSANTVEKETTFNKELFDKAQSEGKVVVVSSWIKYCSSCASQMKILKKAKNDGKLNDIKFDNQSDNGSRDHTRASATDFVNFLREIVLSGASKPLPSNDLQKDWHSAKQAIT